MTTARRPSTQRDIHTGTKCRHHSVVVRGISHQPQRLCFPVAARLLEVDRFAHPDVRVVRNLPTPLPLTPLWMAWQVAWQSSSTSGGRHPSPTQVGKKPSFSPRSVSSSAPSRTSASWDVQGKLGLHDLTRCLHVFQIASPDHLDVLSQLHHVESAPFLVPSTRTLTGLSPSRY